MAIASFDQVLAEARQLTPRERARLVASIVAELAEPAAQLAPETPTDTAWMRLNAFYEEIERLGPAAPSVSAQLADDRRTRQEHIEGRDRVDS